MIAQLNFPGWHFNMKYYLVDSYFPRSMMQSCSSLFIDRFNIISIRGLEPKITVCSTGSTDDYSRSQAWLATASRVQEKTFENVFCIYPNGIFVEPISPQVRGSYGLDSIITKEKYCWVPQNWFVRFKFKQTSIRRLTNWMKFVRKWIRGYTWEYTDYTTMRPSGSQFALQSTKIPPWWYFLKK